MKHGHNRARPSLPEHVLTASAVILDSTRLLVGVCRFVESWGKSDAKELLSLMRQELEVIEDEAYGMAAHFARTAGAPLSDRERTEERFSHLRED
jgi:hypothetical protein